MNLKIFPDQMTALSLSTPEEVIKKIEVIK